MRGFIALLCVCSLYAGGVIAQPAVDVWQVVPPSNPMNCTSTTVTITGWNDAGNYILQPITHSIVNDTIFVEIKYISPQIVLGVLTSWSHTVVLGNISYGNYTVKARGYLGGSYLSYATGWLPVGASCRSAIPQFVFTEDTVCAGDLVSVNNTSTGSNLTYAWDLPNGTSTAQSPTFTAPEGGTYNVTLTVTGDSCSDSIVRVLEVLDQPNVNLGPDTTICDGDSLSLFLPGGNTYLWSDGNTTNTNSINAIGALSVTVTNGDGCMRSDTVAVTGVLDVVEVDLGPAKFGCPGKGVNLNAGTAGSTYLWSTGDTTQTISTTSSGNISVTVSEAGYCDGVDQVSITRHVIVPAEILMKGDSCGDREIWLNSNSHDVIAWFDGSTDTNVTVTTSSMYYVTAADLHGCESIDSQYVNIADFPIVNLGNDTFLCGNEIITLFTGLSGDHVWSTGAIGSVINVTTTGKYRVTVTNAQGCSASDTIKVSDCLGNKELNAVKWSVTPNPAKDKLTFVGSKLTNVQVYDMLGNLVLSAPIVGNSLNVEDLSSGVYFVKSKELNDQILRFVKE